MTSTPHRLYNVSTIARAGGIAVLTAQRRIQSLGIQPAAVLDPLGRAVIPLYDGNALTAVVAPFLKVRQGSVHVRPTDGPIQSQRIEAPICPEASDAAILASMRRGDVGDPLNPNAPAAK
ncbi:hypothetical protein [Horticoccus sp. 23ND18S-11]|uniref:hypothetical protein n=1 Tax=Horticoccus sp. 23ND18S-11 TaxID=3391832 RepID=UPI0039C93869